MSSTSMRNVPAPLYTHEGGMSIDIIDGHGNCIATLSGTDVATARLFAAAPDLYAACMRVIDCEGDGTIYEPDSPFAAIVDAVRKAQGGMQ